MQPDYYDNDLPAPRMTWAESFCQKKDALITTAKLVAVPATLCVLSYAVAYYAGKKIETLC